MPRAYENTPDLPPGPLFLQALRMALFRPSLWLVVWSFFLLLAVVAALPWFGAYHGAMDHRYAPGSLVANLDETFRFDHRALFDTLWEASSATTAVLALMAMLLGVFVAGGWLQVFLEHARSHALRRFFRGGSRYFFRFLRLLPFTLVLLHLAGWLAYGLPWGYLVEELIFGIDDGDYTRLQNERLAIQVQWVQAGLYALLFGLVMTWGDYTRTRLALHDTSSAVWAGLCTLSGMLRHPLRMLAPMLGLFAVEMVVLLTFAGIASKMEKGFTSESGYTDILLLFLVGQAVLIWNVITRGARYQLAVVVSKDVVRPISRPDPWKQAIGGPGGPRYPIDETDDEYGVSL